MAIQVFGNSLFFPESGNLQEFPSPEALKHKIILSTKPPKEYLGGNVSKDGNVPLCLIKQDSGSDIETDNKVIVQHESFLFNFLMKL